ncbi:conserved protein of unknown function [Rhodovastum atsumiense]|uniref:Lipoprotein n=1 Tax=Rhodovastum atsumiense TaxID=504468 RepID=A0A5M6ISS9_9PROT|nr:hypothetical protein [Rhodovastum atsumiense]KAA5610897.1 hypothetical protein F1189_16780 [Rhodovastum atsumiense]CAH2601538.1 conserved protein of unknown function [Rhodovastum atsumiense]
MRVLPPLPLSALPLLALAPLVLVGCGVPWTEPAGAFVAADAATIPVLGRSIGDTVVSGVSGRDCSVVRLDQGLSYCRPPEPPPDVPTFCTRSLGVVDCWRNPEAFGGPPLRGVADGPTRLTPEQEAHRTRRWPGI